MYNEELPTDEREEKIPDEMNGSYEDKMENDNVLPQDRAKSRTKGN